MTVMTLLHNMVPQSSIATEQEVFCFPYTYLVILTYLTELEHISN